MNVKIKLSKAVKSVAERTSMTPEAVVNNILYSYLCIPALDLNDQALVFYLLQKAVDEAEKKGFLNDILEGEL